MIFLFFSLFRGNAAITTDREQWLEHEQQRKRRRKLWHPGPQQQCRGRELRRRWYTRHDGRDGQDTGSQARRLREKTARSREYFIVYVYKTEVQDFRIERNCNLDVFK